MKLLILDILTWVGLTVLIFKIPDGQLGLSLGLILLAFIYGQIKYLSGRDAGKVFAYGTILAYLRQAYNLDLDAMIHKQKEHKEHEVDL